MDNYIPYKKPQAPIMNADTYIFPVTTADQIVMPHGGRLEQNGVTRVDEAANADKALDADKLGGKTWEERMLELHPVGSIVIRADEVEPGSIYGGTWTQIAQGRTLLGAGANEANTDTTYGSLAAGTVNRALGEKGGEAGVSLTVPELAQHSHNITAKSSLNLATSNADILAMGATWDYTQSNTKGGFGSEAVGSGEPHNNMMPYLAVNIWQRTA